MSHAPGLTAQHNCEHLEEVALGDIEQAYIALTPIKHKEEKKEPSFYDYDGPIMPLDNHREY